MIYSENRIDFFWCCRYVGSSNFRKNIQQRWREQQWWITTLEIIGRFVSSVAFLLAVLIIGALVYINYLN
jgi:hypothetical protein